MKSNKRSLILEEAGRIIALEGLDNFSLSHLSERVGITKATLYNYFKSKDEIIDEILAVGHRNFMKKGFSLTLKGSIYDILFSFASLWMDIFLSEDNILFLRIIFSYRLINRKAEEEYKAVSLMARSQSSVVISSFALPGNFERTFSDLLEALLFKWLEKALEGEDIPLEDECGRLSSLIEYTLKKSN